MTQTIAAPVAPTRDPRSLRVALFAACYNDTMWPLSLIHISEPTRPY